MPWQARLNVDYTLESGRTAARFLHDGPLRVLQSLYPEGDAICHQILVHPPGGLVGGDTLDVCLTAHPGSHAVITTPGATRFYRSDAETATQRVRLSVHEGACLEWLPLETLCHSGCLARNHVELDVHPGAVLMGWDITALGLPAAHQPFAAGRLHQRLHWPGVWLEEGDLKASDTELLDGPLGLSGMPCMATLWLAHGTAPNRDQREALEEAARACLDAAATADGWLAGCTSPHPRLTVVRALAPLVEPVQTLLRAVRDAWRPLALQRAAHRPRIWAM